MHTFLQEYLILLLMVLCFNPWNFNDYVSVGHALVQVWSKNNTVTPLWARWRLK